MAGAVDLWTHKEIASFEAFSGAQSDWEAWIVGFEAECATRGISPLTDAIRNDPDIEVGDLASLGPQARGIAENIFN